MALFSAQPYFPGQEPGQTGLLDRFLPVIPVGAARAYLESLDLPKGSLVLDPFGSSPQLVLEMARQGYRVLTAVNNPINRFLVELGAEPPNHSELRSAMAELDSSRKGGERFGAHLQSLYQTICPQCGNSIMAQAFIWERGAQKPVARLLDCPNCGTSGEFDLIPSDLEPLNRVQASFAMHHARTLERVASRNDPDRQHVQEALAYYLARPVYILASLINLLDSLTITPRQKRDLSALLLGVFDETNTLWPQPPDRPRPRVLVVPPRFREKNAWLALEQELETLASSENPIPIHSWPDLPSGPGGICLFEGPLRDLVGQLGRLTISAVVTALPRPNQAFWSLSALWTGWLWGRQAVGEFKHVLRRQRNDWDWHAAALHATLKNLVPHLPLNAPFLAFLPEPEPSFLSAAILAGSSTGFDLRGIALRSVHDPIQIHWQKRNLPRPAEVEILTGELQNALIEFLNLRSEPVTYLHLHSAALVHLEQSNQLTWQAEAMHHIHTPLHQVLESDAFTRFEGTQASLETGFWYLGQPAGGTASLPDRVETLLMELFTRQSKISFRDAEWFVNQELRGLLTPQLGILRNVLQSYAVQTGEHWLLRSEDQPDHRLVDMDEIRSLLEKLGIQLGYKISAQKRNGQTLSWTLDGQDEYSFFVLACACVGEVLSKNAASQGKRCLVIPGGRAGLLSYKLIRDPSLKQLADGWSLLKFRQVRLLAEDATLSRQSWLEALLADPVTEPEQMRLF